MQDDPMLVEIILVLVGVFSALGGIMDWDWFMENRRAQPFVQLLGRNGARGFYVLLGLGFAGVGIGLATGLLR